MKGAKPKLVENVIPMKGDIRKPVPEAPAFLTEGARRVWDELAAVLVGKDRLQPEFQYLFAGYCEAVANFIDATACLALEGFYFETLTRNGKQQKVTAAFRVQAESLAMMTRLSALFGLSPIDEARMKNGGGQGDLFDDIVRQLKNGPG